MLPYHEYHEANFRRGRINRQSSIDRHTFFQCVRSRSSRFPDDPDIVVANANRFGFVGRSFKERVHRIANLIETSLRNHKAIVSSKLNEVRLDGESHKPSGLVFAVGVGNARDEFTKRQRLLLVIDLHGKRMGRETARALWGVSPNSRLTTPMPAEFPVKVPSISEFVFMR